MIHHRTSRNNADEQNYGLKNLHRSEYMNFQPY